MSFKEIKNEFVKVAQNDSSGNNVQQKSNEKESTFINFKDEEISINPSIKDIINGDKNDIYDQFNYTTFTIGEEGGNSNINLDEIDYSDINSIIQPTMAEHEGGGDNNIDLLGNNIEDINAIIQPTMAEHEGGGDIGGINLNELPNIGNLENILNGDAKAEKIKEEIFNDDGSLNAEKAGELFESGELTVWDFEKVFGVTPNMSEQAKATLDDGTTVYCEDMRWSGMTDSAVMIVTLPDGQELRFEQKDKGKLTDTPNIEKPEFKETTRAMGEEGGSLTDMILDTETAGDKIKHFFDRKYTDDE